MDADPYETAQSALLLRVTVRTGTRSHSRRGHTV